MNPKELILAAKLSEARSELVDMVKKAPTDITARSQLFQVLILYGEWDKAFRHLEIMAGYNPTPDMDVAVYENLFQAEKERAQVARLAGRPGFVPEIPDYIEDYWQALELMAAGKSEEASSQLAKIQDARPAVSGTINGNPFAGFEDTDSTLSCFIEAIEYERYLWVPIESIRELVVMPPKTLMDLIWAKGRITTWGGLTMGAFFPVTYPLSFAGDDDRVRLGQMTDWQSLGHGLSKAVGQHVYQVGEADIGLLELGEVIFTLADTESKGEIDG